MAKPLDDRSAAAFMAQPHAKAMLDSFGPVPDGYATFADIAALPAPGDPSAMQARALDAAAAEKARLARARFGG